MYGVIDLLHEHLYTHEHVFINVCTKQRMGCQETEMKNYIAEWHKSNRREDS